MASNVRSTCAGCTVSTCAGSLGAGAGATARCSSRTPAINNRQAAAAACLLLMAGVLLEHRAVAPAPAPNDMAQVDSVQPEQVERTLDAMEMLNEFSHHVRTDSPDSKLKIMS